MTRYTTTETRRDGEKVTTRNSMGGLGLGYLMPDGEVYKSSGSFFAVNAKADVFPMVCFERDGCRKYFTQANEVLS